MPINPKNASEEYLSIYCKQEYTFLPSPVLVAEVVQLWRSEFGN
jgi:hypothetical protein